MIFVRPNRHADDHQQLHVANDGVGQCFVEIVVAVDTQPEIQAAEAISVAEGARIELDALWLHGIVTGCEGAYDATAATGRPAPNLRSTQPMPRKLTPWLLLIPFIALLCVPLYNRTQPTVAGFPFFYVWQFAWVVLAALLTWVVHRGWRR
ncbi:MAG TPA: DUF3311 domain-containing protein [Rhodanobacteraceae bacterium]|nr:DUF3311 domain-containing protein [Rhodanobacteraceae bacterium]